MKQIQQQALKVYFDGLCPICSREIDHYREQKHSDRLMFVDIASPGFSAKTEGLDPEGIHKRFHVKTAEGTIYEGVPAFVEIWKTLEIWKPLQWAAENPLLNPIFNLGYTGFAKIRPLLRNQPCDSDYCETNI